jgi:hypothetical protein
MQCGVVALAVITLTAAQMLDLGTFVRMIASHGFAVEANPLAAHLLAEFGLPFTAVAKVVALSVAVAVTVVLAERSDRPGHPRLARAVVGVAVMAGIVGGWTNSVVLI